MTEPRRFEPPEVRQILIPPALWDLTQMFFIRLGYIPAQVPLLSDDVPTYSLVLGRPEDLVEIGAEIRKRINDTPEPK